MPPNQPQTEVDARYSSEGANPTPWPEARAALETAEVYWLSSVRTNGVPHTTPLIAIWHDDCLYFCTGPAERKARNLASNPNVTVTTGRNSLNEGMDVVLEGQVAVVTDTADMQQLSTAYAAKYGWRFEVRDGAFVGDGGEATVFALRPRRAFAFAKGGVFSQTRYLFE